MNSRLWEFARSRSASIRPMYRATSLARPDTRFPFFPIRSWRRFVRTTSFIRAQGINGADIARPAEFLLDSSGTVRWVNLTENYWVRARPEQIIDAAKALR